MAISGDVFVKGNVAITHNGVAMRNNPRTFTLAYSDLDIGRLRLAVCCVCRGVSVELVWWVCRGDYWERLFQRCDTSISRAHQHTSSTKGLQSVQQGQARAAGARDMHIV